MPPFPPRDFTAKLDFTVYFFFLEGLCTVRGILIYPFNNNAFTFYSISQKTKSLNYSFFAHYPYTLVGTVFAQNDTQRKKYSHVEGTNQGLTGCCLGRFLRFVWTGAQCRLSQHTPEVPAPLSWSSHSGSRHLNKSLE